MSALNRRGRPQRLILHNVAPEEPMATAVHVPVHEADTPGQSGIRSASEQRQDGASQTKGTCNNGGRLRHRERIESLHVSWTEEDVERMAREIHDESIAAVHLSLLGWWICENAQHYNIAKKYIRELSLDQGYNVDRISNNRLRELLISTETARPWQAREKANGKLAHVVKYDETQADEYSEEEARKLLAGTSIFESAIIGYWRVSAKHTSGNLEEGNLEDADDVFGIGRDRQVRRSDPFDLADAIRDALPEHYGTAQEEDLNTVPHDDHVPHDDQVASERACESDGTSTDTMPPGPPSEPSMVESVSTDETRPPRGVQYSFYPTIRPMPVRRAPLVPTTAPIEAPRAVPRFFSQRAAKLRQRTLDWAQTFVFGPAPDLSSASTYQPQLFPVLGGTGPLNKRTVISPPATTAVVQDGNNNNNTDVSTHDTRAQHKHKHETAELPVATASSPGLEDDDDDDDDEDDEDDDLTPRPSHDDNDLTPTASRDDDDTAKMPSRFPVPPVHNPILALPMLVAAAIYQSDAADRPDQAIPAPNAPVSAVPSSDPVVLASQIRAQLVLTRAHAQGLPMEWWEAMSPVEKAWREQHKEALMWILGRQDTWLGPGDVKSVERVSKTVQANKEHWVIQVLGGA
ncbi:hypothetical protein ACEQ8H_004848 [Pleosporales sp. CAS-2024a]